MVQRTLVLLSDDLDGSEAAETVQLAVNGHSYEIDLSERNAAKLRKALDPYLSAARRVGGRKRSSVSAAPPPTKRAVDNKAVRAWAESNGIEINTRGRIPASVLEQYGAAGY